MLVCVVCAGAAGAGVCVFVCLCLCVLCVSVGGWVGGWCLCVVGVSV